MVFISIEAFFVYAQKMKKYLTLAFLLLLTPHTVWAQSQYCPTDSLQLDFIHDNFRINNAYLHGAIDTPNPGYVYTLVFKPHTNEGVLHGTMTIRKKRPDMMAITVITPLDINHKLSIPVGTSRIMIDVVKGFNWGPEYFAGKPSKFNSFCLKGEQYK